MIRLSDLTPENVGRRVLDIHTNEPGMMTSCNNEYIFVRYQANPQGNTTRPGRSRVA